MAQKTQQMGIVGKILLSVVLVAMLLAALLCVEISSSDAFAADGLIFDAYTKSVLRDYNGSEDVIRVNAPSDAPVTYTWYKDGAFFGYGNTLTVKYPADNGIYSCEAVDGNGLTSVEPAEVTVNIIKAVCEVYIPDVEVFYGDEEVLPTYTVGSMVAGDSAEDLNISLSRDPGIHAGSYSINGFYSSDRYTVRFSDAKYIIKKIPVTVDVISVESEYGEPMKELLYEAENPEVLVNGDTVEDLGVILIKEDGESAGRYAITGSATNSNYEVNFRPATYTVKPKRLAGRLVGVNGLVYNGRMPEITFEIIGEGRDLPLKTVISFDRMPVLNAGEYTAYVRFDDRNYETDATEYPFAIAKAALTVKLSDAAYSLPQEASFVFGGFVNGEDASDLAEQPRADMPKAAGSYKIMPYGLKSDNYEAEYFAGNITVYKTELSADNAVFTGAFAPDAVLSVSEGGEGLNGYERINRLAVRTFDISIGGIDGEYTAQIDCDGLFPLFLRACIVDSDGEKHNLNGFSFKDGSLRFKADSDGLLIFYYDLTVPAIIVAVLVLIVLIIIIKFSRDRKRYNRAIALQYAAKYNAAEAVGRAKEQSKEI